MRIIDFVRNNSELSQKSVMANKIQRENENEYRKLEIKNEKSSGSTSGIRINQSNLREKIIKECQICLII